MASHPDVNIPGADPSDVIPPTGVVTNNDDNDSIRCFTCDSLETYVDLSQGYIEAVSLALYDPVLTIFAALVGLWVVVSALQIWLAMVSPVHLIRDFLGIVIAFSLLTAQGGEFISDIYEVCLDIMGSAAIVAFTIGPGAPTLDGDGVVGMMEATEAGVEGVFVAAFDVLAEWSPLNFWPVFYAIALIVPYFVVVVVFFSKVVVSIFRLMMLGILAPFLIMFFAFGWGRQMAIAGLKTVLSAMFVLFAAAASVGLLFYGVDIILDQGDINQGLGADGSQILSSHYLTLLILGWVGTALMTEGIGLANSITGSLLSNVAAGIISGAVTATAGAGIKFGYNNPGQAALGLSSLGLGSLGGLGEALGGLGAAGAVANSPLGRKVGAGAVAGGKAIANAGNSIEDFANGPSNSPSETTVKSSKS